MKRRLKMDVFLGLITIFPYGFVPRGWMLCDGTLLPVTQYQALYSLIGNKFGGNGSTNFALPNLQGGEPIPNTRYYIAIEGLYPTRE